MADAKRRVEIIVWTNREKEKPTHFISIPLTVPHIKDRVSLFKSSVLDSCRRVSNSRLTDCDMKCVLRREGYVKMCSSYLRSSTSLSESCGFSLKKNRFASLPSYCCSYCIYTYIGEGKSSGEGSYCNGQVNKIENLLCSYF